VIRPFRGGAAVDWLIVGLGNPGREYAATRHNVGFMVADALAESWDLPKPKARFRGLLAEGRVRAERAGEPSGSGSHSPSASAFPSADVMSPAAPGPLQREVRVALLWPQTFMNDVGRSVGPARGSLKLPLDRLLVVHDEIDLPFGEVRTRLGGGLAGHNGLKSLKRELGGADFWRVRVGVGRPDSTDPEIVSAHVLGRFRESAEDVRELVKRAGAEVQQRIATEPAGAEAQRMLGEES
jgi:peptidyl-tRNA hydrolase, PTH1 family